MTTDTKTIETNAVKLNVSEPPTRSGNEWLPELSPSIDIVRQTTPEGFKRNGTTTKQDYYGIPILKRPSWKWEIALYFFFEGISAGAFLMGSLADLFGKNRFRELSRAGYYTSFLALMPCPPLLIADLGRPERFHHMLRVFKPNSPMNLGAWALTGYSLPVTLSAARQLVGDVFPEHETLKKASQLVPAHFIGALGIPFALTMTSYPGVLLSTTSTPVWSKTRFLGALFACSSISNGIAATSLALAIQGDGNRRAIKQLEKIENISSLCEGAALVAFLVTSGKTAEPLTKGHYAKHFWIGAVGAGLVLPAVIRVASSKGRKKSRASSILGSALTLAGGLALKWAVTHAGRVSAEDVEASHDAARPSESAPGWSPDAKHATAT